jgi:hypothetical protein
MPKVFISYRQIDDAQGNRVRSFARGIGHELKKEYSDAITAYRQVIDLFRTLSAESVEVGLVLIDLSRLENLSGDLSAAGMICTRRYAWRTASVTPKALPSP